MAEHELIWEDFENLVREYIPDRELAKIAVIGQETCLFQDLKYDSTAIVGLLAIIEERYGVDFTDLPDFMRRMDRCGDFYEGIQELLHR